MPTILTNGIQLPDKGSVDWYGSMQSNYNLIDTHLGNTDIHVTAEDKANWNSKQGSLSQAQLDAIAQVATNTSDIATLQSGKANASHTHSSSDITDIGDYATKQYVDNSISGLVDSAPNALDTLNELAAALNDDANFASTVTTALSAKANSADLATVATSGDYDDLSNKPTINDSTITIQKNGSTVDTFTTNGYAKTIDIPVPTKTSDLTNDSNFVDTSNSAVASGITSAKVTDYDSHIADTDIHVTTADKTKWNNGVSQAYVFRYSSTALVASSTNSNSLLDNTDNLKVGDKVIDSSGVLFSVTAIDSVNSTFTIGSALVDLALDANVVHTSGNETKSGELTLSDTLKSSDIVPLTNLNFNLGSPDYKYNNVYAYMYNSIGRYFGNESSSNQRTNITLYANRDTLNQSCAYITRFRPNRSQGALQPTDLQKIGFDVLENEVRTNNVFDIQCTDWLNNVPQKVNLVSSVPSYSYGRSSNKALINDLNPGSLSLPDLDNGIDISGYLTNLNGSNTYTPVVNGWLSLGCANPSAQNAMYAYDEVDGWGISARSISHSSYGNFMVMSLPVFANKTINIELRSVSNVVWAKFFPCQGNV